LAAALTQRELAEMVGSNQTTMADLENWDGADPGMLRRLCGALHLAPEDLIFRGTVDETAGQQGRDPRAASTSAEAWTERRRQVNRIKKRGHFSNPYTGGHANVAPGTVLLRGLKGCRASAGLTQRELAKMIGTNQTTIQQLEKGTRRGAYVSTVKKLCRTLGVSPADVICK
jgi:DNA-binding XRE family transcriptional regulator